MIGKKITWVSANGRRTGVITGAQRFGWFVRLDSGKKTIVHPKSIIEYG